MASKTKPPDKKKPTKVVTPTKERKERVKAAPAGKPKRPAAPTTFSFELHGLIVCSWYDQGMRHAAGTVEQRRYTWSDELERWQEQIELLLFPALCPRMHVTVVAHRAQWVGARETVYELREPNPKERLTAEDVMSRSTGVTQQKVSLGTGHLTSVRVNGLAEDVQNLLKRKGGATMFQLREVAPKSAGSILHALRKAGLNIATYKNSDGSRTYAVPGEGRK